MLTYNTNSKIGPVCGGRALSNTNYDTEDAVIMHSPGTMAGDKAELNAINYIFKNDPPILVYNKWKIG